MSFLGALKQGQPASQSAYIDHPVPVANRLNLADHLHIRQMERMLQHTLEELEQVKARLNQLEKSPANRGEPDVAADKITEQQMAVSSAPPLPIDEIRRLAEMAKRFR